VFRACIGEPTQFQLSLFDLFLSEGPHVNRTVAKYHRRVGLTSAVAAFIVWYALAHNNRMIVNVDVMHKHKTMYNFITDMFEQLDDELKFVDNFQGLYTRCYRNSEIGLTTNNKILFRSTSERSLRGMTVSLAVLNDIDSDSELFYNCIPAMAAIEHSLVLQLFEKAPPVTADLMTTDKDVLS
jgi:hypothetical protein